MPAPDPFRAIADPTRRALLDRLRAGPAAVNTLAAAFSQTRPAISRHLRVLRQAHLVREEPLGRERIYRLDAVGLQPVSGWLEGYRAFWHQSLGNLKALLESAQPAPPPRPAPTRKPNRRKPR
jgi:DNA-binding transcriptional ArsR family regulator